MASGEWMGQARCVEVDVDPIKHFDPPEGTTISRWLCRTCPVREPCVEHLLAIETQAGYGGGLTEARRRRLRTSRKEVRRRA